MGEVIQIGHARASAKRKGAARAARLVKRSEVTPASAATLVPMIADHHSDGMASRCHHFETCDGVAPIADAKSILSGQSSMMDRNEQIMSDKMGQIVPNVKAIMSPDCEKEGGHNVRAMEHQDTEIIDRRFREAFQERLREIQGKRRDEEMASLLNVGVDRYKKWKNRAGSQFPMFLLPKLCAIGATHTQGIARGSVGALGPTQ
ncbi:MAG: hypothetical protein WDN48_06305 [Pseudolabrys sp.]